VVNGHAFTPPKTEAYEQAAGLCIMQAMTRCRWTLGTRGPFRVELDVYRAAERGDIDNYAKSILDAATRARAWSDDARVTELEVRLFVDRVKPRVEGRIRVEVEVAGEIHRGRTS
jgi:Holliday junction resolvase RusA-like endonuclease